jgi:hypothetical protein
MANNSRLSDTNEKVSKSLGSTRMELSNDIGVYRVYVVLGPSTSGIVEPPVQWFNNTAPSWFWDYRHGYSVRRNPTCIL